MVTGLQIIGGYLGRIDVASSMAISQSGATMWKEQFLVLLHCGPSETVILELEPRPVTPPSVILEM